MVFIYTGTTCILQHCPDILYYMIPLSWFYRACCCYWECNIESDVAHRPLVKKINWSSWMSFRKKEEKALNSQPWPKSADLQSDPHIDRWVFAFCEPWYCAKTKSIKYAKFRSTSACDDHNMWVLIELNDMAIFFAEIKL